VGRGYRRAVTGETESTDALVEPARDHRKEGCIPGRSITVSVRRFRSHHGPQVRASGTAQPPTPPARQRSQHIAALSGQRIRALGPTSQRCLHPALTDEVVVTHLSSWSEPTPSEQHSRDSRRSLVRFLSLWHSVIGYRRTVPPSMLIT
jgi:hypothetical protein